MINNKNEKRKMIEIAKKKGLVKKYSEFCKSKEGKDSNLSKEELNYYISKNN